MDVIDVFRERHRFAQEIFYDHLWHTYSEQQLREPPHPKLNSLAWFIWHIARVEDAGVSRFFARVPQVLDTGDWNTKLGVSRRDFGWGMSHQEMLDISRTINLLALRDYHQAVIEHVFNLLNRVDPNVYDEVLTTTEVTNVLLAEEVAAASNGEYLIPIYSGWTRIEALYHFSVTHYYWHGGDVRTLETLLQA